jgi:glutathione S-transferase
VITLYQFEISPYCDKIRRVLHWKGLEYEVREVPLAAARSTAKRINPAGKLPCLDHDGRIVADSTDIAYYLEEAFPEPPLLPKDPRDRALCHFFEDWADESLYFYEMRLRFTFPHNAARWIPELVHADRAPMKLLAPWLVPTMLRRQTAAQGVGRKSEEQVVADVERHAGALADWLADREWLVGTSLSLADISVFAQLFCIRGADEGRRSLESRSVIAAWMDRVDRATSRR